MESVTTEQKKSPPPLFKAARAGSAIGLSTFAALIAGFLLQLSIAYKFGAGSGTDAYFMAQGTSELLAKILLGGSITSVFLPIFVEYLQGNQQERAWRLGNNLFHVSALAFVIVLTVLEIFTDQIVYFIAPGFSTETHVITVFLLRLMLPAFFFTMLMDLAASILNSLHVFGVPAFCRLVSPLISFVLVITLANRFGIYTLGFGTLIGGTIQLAIVLYALKGVGFKYRPILSLTDPDLRRVFVLVSPFILSILAAQAAGVVYRIIVSHFPEGSLSAIKFGDKLSQMTNSLFLTNIVTVSFPAFSRAVASGIQEEIVKTTKQAFRIMIFFGIPLTIGIILLRTNVVRVLYQRGSFTAEDAGMTSAVLGILLFGLLANGLSSLLGHLALAMKVTRVSVIVTIATQILSIGLFAFLGPRFGIKGLAMGSAISPFILVTLYAIALTKRIPTLWKIFADLSLIKIFICGVTLFVGSYAARQVTTEYFPGLFGDLFTIACTALLGLTAYLATAFTLRVPELNTMKEIMYYAIKKKTS